MTDRRTFLHSAAPPAWPRLACPPSPPPALRDKHPLIIDALEYRQHQPAGRAAGAAYDFGIDARALADAKASGLNAFNMTIGYVFGDATLRKIAGRRPRLECLIQKNPPICCWCAAPPISGAPRLRAASASSSASRTPP
jgi:hypothetical protein